MSQLAAASQVVEGQVLEVQIDGKPVLLTRVDGQPKAVSARCPHLGLPLTRGKIEGGAIRCPFHGSRFDLATGANLDWVNGFAGIATPKWTHGLIALGKRPADLTTWQVEERDGGVFVRHG